MIRWAAIAAISLGTGLLATPGCNCRRVAEDDTHSEPEVDLSLDRAELKSSWLIEIATDPAPLGALAESNAGWSSFFQNDPKAAYDAFAADFGEGDTGRIGAARAALQISEALQNLADIVVEACPRLARAQPPTLGQGWQAWMLGRHAIVTGKDPSEHWKTIPAASPAGAWRDAVTAEAPDAVGQLLLGRAGGLGATLPPGASQVYVDRLVLGALVAANKPATAILHGLKAVERGGADIVVQEGDFSASFSDPVVANVSARAYALLALDALGDTGGWATLLRARGLHILGRYEEALTAVDALLAAPPEKAPLALLVLSSSLNAADLGAEVSAQRVVILADLKRTEDARLCWSKLPSATVGQRVTRALAGTWLGESVTDGAFPSDRAALANLIADEVVALGKQAKGAGDVTELALVERYVDAVQRRYGLSLMRADDPVSAMRAYETAEDKARAAAPSLRNTLPALTAAALANARIGRPRVALTYLSRMTDRLSEASVPAETLRDLLTIVTMEQDARGATAGQ